MQGDRASQASSPGIRILSTSAHPELGPLRAQVLRAAGYDVTFPADHAETVQALERGRFDVLILGHSIVGAPAKNFVELFRQRNPSGKVLVVYQSGLVPVRGDAAISAIEGPEVLIGTIERLCGRGEES